jgi:hypothetical protein
MLSPVKSELGFYIPEDGILHSHRRENLKSYNNRTVVGCPVFYEVLVILRKVSDLLFPPSHQKGRPVIRRSTEMSEDKFHGREIKFSRGSQGVA